MPSGLEAHVGEPAEQVAPVGLALLLLRVAQLLERGQLARVYVRLKKTEDAQRELAAFKQLSDAQKQKRETDRRDLLRRLANVRF